MLTSATLDLQARLSQVVELGPADGPSKISLGLSEWGRDVMRSAGVASRDGLSLHHGDVEQFWRTHDGHLEFGFVVGRADGPGDLRLDLAVHRTRVDGDVATLIGPEGDEVDLRGLRAWDADGMELEAAFEPLEEGLRIRVDVGQATFPVTIDPLLDSPSWTTNGSAYAHLGSAVAHGDWNGDGLSDVAIGAPRASNTRWREGAVHVFFGPGLSSTPDVELFGGRSGARFGSALAGGDLDGDGLDELVVGAPGWSDGQLEEGAVLVFSNFNEVFTWESDVLFASAGASVAVDSGALLVGAPGWTGSRWLEGAVFGWSGLGGAPVWTTAGGSRLARAGRSVALGDVDADGVVDAVWGEPGKRTTLWGEGRVRVAMGDGVSFGSPNWSAFGSQRGAGLGRSVAVADGVVFAGAPGWNGEAHDEGAVFGWDGLGAMPTWSMRSGQAHARLGTVAGGDLNGDGATDLVLGAPRWDEASTDEGAVFAIARRAYGWPQDADVVLSGGQGHALMGTALAVVGDVDGDGFGDALVGAPGWDGSTWNEGQAAVFAGMATDFDLDGDPSHLDCDDEDAAVHGLDHDGDGFDGCSAPTDCDDTTPQIAPDAPEACDGTDNDCDGWLDEADPDFSPDTDGDGFLTDGCGVGGTDCDDNDGHVFPDSRQTSGPLSQCLPAVYPGFSEDWHHARLSEANHFEDPEGGGQFLYFRGHADQSMQAIGVAHSVDGVVWDVAGVALSGGETGAWDEQNTSNPAVVYVPGAVRPYLMLYHAKDAATGTRAVGLASATSAWGPFERLDSDGVDVLAPVLPPSTDPTFGDSFRTLHPAAWRDADSGLLHLWYNGRSAADSTLRIFHATSPDGVVWERTDDDAVNGPDPIWSPSESWHGTRVTQASVLPDPASDELLFWFTGDQASIGAASGDVTDWSPIGDGPALSADADCRRFDGYAVTARGMRHDASEDVFHWYYTAQTDLFGCPDNDDPWFDNPWGAVSYVGHAVNVAPVVTVGTTSDASVEGTVADTFPEGVIVTVSSDVDGYLGAATVEVGGGPGVVEVGWSLIVDPPMSAGPHELTVSAVDEGGVVRSVDVLMP